MAAATITGMSTLLAALAGGAVLAAGYMAALRATVDRLPTARRPGTLLLASVLARMGIALVAFYAIAKYAQWPGLVAALVGFMIVRTVVVRHGLVARKRRTDLPTGTGG